MSVRYLTLEEVLLQLTMISPDLRVHDLGLLDSAIHRPRSGFAGIEVYPSIEEKAAALLHSLVKNHALFDGNKRLGTVACLTFLHLNGKVCTLTDDELYDLVLDLASCDMETGVLAQRLRISDK